MVLPVVKYGTPVLRQRGAAVTPGTPETTRLVADMFDTMYAAKGIGLAAQQIGQALQLTVIDVRGVKDRPSHLWIDGHPADVDAFMPLVLLNPKIEPQGDKVRGPEGCLSFPEIYGEIDRPTDVEVIAQNERGEEFRFRAGGLLSRAIQHEVDHLNGILFIDRMDTTVRSEVKDDADALMAETKRALAKKA
jgi:peptide deformylase